MGAALGRVWSKGFLGGFGTPQARPELAQLLNWTREELTNAYQKFCMQQSISVSIVGFGEILTFDSRDEEEAAFRMLNPKKDRVDMLSVFGAMTAASNQRFISRVSLFFSMFDLDGSGSINRAELFIAVRALFQGVAYFFEGVVIPSKRELEDLTADVFEEIDADHSGVITLGELLNFAYRSGTLKAFLEPFPSEDQRLNEGAAPFVRNSADFMDTTMHVITDVERKLELLPGTGDCGKPLGRRRSSITNFRTSTIKPLPRPKAFSKAHTWFMYKVFVHMAGQGFSPTIPAEAVKKIIADHQIMDDIIDKVSEAAGLVVAPRQKYAGAPSRHGVAKAGEAADLAKLIAHLQGYFHDRGALMKLDSLGEGCVTVRAFFCVVLPSLSEGEIETCLTWCHSFRGHDVLTEYLDNGNLQCLSCQDAQAICTALDADGNGVLTLDELQTCADLSETQAKHLLERLDLDQSESLSVDKLSAILRTVDMSLKRSFHEAFEHFDILHGFARGGDDRFCT